MALGDQRHAEHVDGGGLTDAGRAGDADPHRIAGGGEKRLHQIARLRLMIGAAAFNQRDRARQRGAVAGANGIGKGSGRHVAFHFSDFSLFGRSPPKIARPSGDRKGFSAVQGTNAS